METPREALEYRAYQLYEMNPTWGRRRVAKALRDEYGQALRDAELDKIRKTTFAYKAMKEQQSAEEFRVMQLVSKRPDITLTDVRKQLIADFERPLAGQKTIRAYREAAFLTEEMVRLIRARRGKILVNPVIKVRKPRPIITQQKMPEVPQPVYRDRARTLSAEGFMKWEWQWFAFHDIDSPAMKRLRRDRRQEVRRWIDNLNLTPQQIEARILERYKREGWFFTDGRFNPFKMIDQYYRTDDSGQPTDKTPSNKRRAGNTDFMEAKRKTLGGKPKWRYGIDSL